MNEFVDEESTRPEPPRFMQWGIDEPTQPIPHETLAEIAAKWREQIALEDKQLRALGSAEVTQPLPVGGLR